MASVPTEHATTPAQRLRAAAGRVPGRDALRWQDRSTTYVELDRRVDAAVAGLAGLGIGPGDRVALVLPNTPTFVEAWYAVLRLGAVAVPAAPVLAADELRHLLADSGAVAAVVTSSGAATVSSLRGQLDDLRTVIAADGGVDGAPAGDRTWSSVVADGRGADRPPERDGDAGDLAALVYTSGTTGRPRGAMLTAASLVANQDQSLVGRLRLVEDDVVLCVLPLFHIYGLNVVLGPAITTGCTVVLQERFDPVTTADLVASHGVTVVPGAPPMFAAWAQQPPTDRFGSVRLCASGAAPLPRTVAAAFTEATGLPVHQGYGLTEAAPAVSSSAQDDEVRPGSVGRPLPGVELRLVDDGDDVEQGDPGEVWVRGPNVFAGYWHDDEATARVLTDDGWLRTGDVGVLDEDGWLHLVDRRTDLILVSGFNVYPREIERVLRRHPAVAEVAVVGAPHPTTGETPVAHVVRAGDAEIVEQDLDAHCQLHLASYKCPTSYRVVRTLPVTVTGKVRRTDLRLD